MLKIANEELGRLSVAEFKAAEKRRVILVLDNIRSMHNVGSAFRTADSFLLEKILDTEGCSRSDRKRGVGTL